MISNSFTVFESLKVVLMIMLAIFMMPVKLATVGLPQINIFWNRGFDLITSVYGVTNEILSLYLNYIVDVIMRPKFGNPNISMREVIIFIRI